MSISHTTIRLLLTLSTILHGIHGHPVSPKPDPEPTLAPRQIQLDIFSEQRPNFPGPYTLLPDPSLNRRHAPPAPSVPVVAESRSGGYGPPWGPPHYPWSSHSMRPFPNSSTPTTGPASPFSTGFTVPHPITSTFTSTRTVVTTSTSIVDTSSSVASAIPTASTSIPSSGSSVAVPTTPTSAPTTSASSIPETTPVSSLPNTTLSTAPASSTLTTSIQTTSTASSEPTSTSSSPPIQSTTPTTLTTIASSSPTTSTPISTPTNTAPAIPGYLQIDFTNNLGSSNVHVYITGLNSAGQVTMLNTAGQYYNPTTSSSTPVPVPAEVSIPLPSSLILPGYLSSCRMWFADGTLDFTIVATPDGTGLVAPTTVNPTDPSHDTNWGFIELTWIESGLFGDISYVDFVPNLALGLQLTTTSGDVQSVPGVPNNAADTVCSKLQAIAAADGQPWDQLCVNNANGDLIRVLSPGSFIPANPNAFADYYTPYVDSVWQTYTSSVLTINTQNSLGNVACQVGGDGLLTCAGDNRGYAKPSAADIFSCASGPFAIESGDNAVHLAVVPRLCAAFVRATFLLSGGNVEPSLPPTSYYTTEPSDQYSKVTHEIEAGGMGYTFPYDDVSPSENENVAGAIFATDPSVLTIIVG